MPDYEKLMFESFGALVRLIYWPAAGEGSRVFDADSEFVGHLEN